MGKKDGMVIEILKQPDIIENYGQIQLEMINLYTKSPDNIKKGGKSRWLINQMDLAQAQKGGGDNDNNYHGPIYEYDESQKTITQEGNSWEDYGYVQVGGATKPNAAPAATPAATAPVFNYMGRIEPAPDGTCPNKKPNLPKDTATANTAEADFKFGAK